MFGPRASFAMAAALVAAVFLLLAPPVLAGPTYHAPQPQPAPHHPAAPPRPLGASYAMGSPVTVSVVVAPAPRPPEPAFYVNLRGPDGVVRRFPVEGGRAAIQAPPVVVLRPGESVTLHLQAVR
jgi:hypothetical protein